MHPIIDDLQWRYTCKKYDSTKRVSKENLAIIFESLRLSASSINSQPWKFIVIDSEKAKQRFSKTFKNKYQFNLPHVFDSSQIILFAHNPQYQREDYSRILDQAIKDQRTKPEDKEGAFGAFIFAEMNTDENGSTANWTKSQTYLALGNVLHTLARLKIDSTPLEGVDSELISEEFKTELAGHKCDVALAIGYRHATEDYNAKLPKSRLALDQVLIKL